MNPRALILSIVVLRSAQAQTQAASADRWTNSLGMVFVPVPDTPVRFCIWETRIQDYGVFVREGHWGRLWPERATFQQESNHPVGNVSWEDAKGFGIWLTQREQNAGLLRSSQVYRLPTDLEWSAAVGLPKESGRTAQRRALQFPNHYPWGTEEARDREVPRQGMKIPPATIGRDGNYQGEADGYKVTAPVGSFNPNRLGIHDLGGNVWEWCVDYAEDGRRHILRGGSWSNGPLPSSFRDFTLPNDIVGNFGFRCVLADAPSAP